MSTRAPSRSYWLRAMSAARHCTDDGEALDAALAVILAAIPDIDLAQAEKSAALAVMQSRGLKSTLRTDKERAG